MIVVTAFFDICKAFNERVDSRGIRTQKDLVLMNLNVDHAFSSIIVRLGGKKPLPPKT